MKKPARNKFVRKRIHSFEFWDEDGRITRKRSGGSEIRLYTGHSNQTEQIMDNLHAMTFVEAFWSAYRLSRKDPETYEFKYQKKIDIKALTE